MACAAPAFVAGIGGDEGFVQNQRSILEACIQIAVQPTHPALSHAASRPVLASAKSASVHFSSPMWGGGGLGGFSPGFGGGTGGSDPELPSIRGFGPPGRRRVQRIDGERQWLELDVDLLR